MVYPIIVHYLKQNVTTNIKLYLNNAQPLLPDLPFCWFKNGHKVNMIYVPFWENTLIGKTWKQFFLFTLKGIRVIKNITL